MLLQLGTKTAVSYTLNGSSFSSWIGTVDEAASGPNYLAVLTLGWCYILSVRLVELQSEGATMRYTAPRATKYDQATRTDGGDPIDIGDADEETVSWWSSVLAAGQGWKAPIKQCDDGTFLAPWSLTTTGNQPLHFKWREKGSAGKSHHPYMSSERAFEILSPFALLHNLGSQFFVALAAAVTVPTHNHHGTTLQLPYPTHTGGRCPARSTKSVPLEWSMLYKDLDYYITLSCSPEVIISSLCGTFWEPCVPCNIVSHWLHSILDEMPAHEKISSMPGLYAEILAIVGGIRRPTISALWLGAVASGLTPVILRRIRRARPPLSPVAFAWTGSPQSFNDFAGTGPYFIGKMQEEIWRADVWRLLYLPQTEEDELSFNYQPGHLGSPVGR